MDIRRHLSFIFKEGARLVASVYLILGMNLIVNKSLNYLSIFSQDHINAFEKEGWAYAPTFDGKFHAQARNADFVRRRRYLNKLTPKGGAAIKEFPPVLRVKLKGKVKDKVSPQSHGTCFQLICLWFC